ncbi:MAG: response regulator transcription factor [Candidatus Cellulosilyticum pullistercoris]|uniref:Stage 0 sporulation protein A homolog n=1 Tax=Candidatus Cellulosilyticum pullistercoris TaxID=2838521 RepID=A0A9E2NKW2_9FIRM|nr:response regulator transcription factor [Candidatus Cellulosilyticum pullistercoris]
MQKIGIIEDEKNISDMIKYNLEKEGYEVFTAYDGTEGLALIEKESLDLLLLDIMLPNIDGLEVCKKVRQKMEIPIIIISAKADEFDKVLALELGADDYVTKPFSIREVMARIKARLRRKIPELTVPEEGGDQLREGNLEMDLKKYEVSKNGEVIELTLREFELLKFLWQSKGEVFTREDLLTKVWGYEYYGDVRTVDVTIRRLREKIEDDASKASFVLTKRGVGYYFRG